MFRKPKPQGEHFYSTPQDKQQRQHDRSVKRINWISWSVALFLFVVLMAVVGYGVLPQYDDPHLFREPLTEDGLKRLV